MKSIAELIKYGSPLVVFGQHGTGKFERVSRDLEKANRPYHWVSTSEMDSSAFFGGSPTPLFPNAGLIERIAFGKVIILNDYHNNNDDRRRGMDLFSLHPERQVVIITSKKSVLPESFVMARATYVEFDIGGIWKQVTHNVE